MIWYVILTYVVFFIVFTIIFFINEHIKCKKGWKISLPLDPP